MFGTILYREVSGGLTLAKLFAEFNRQGARCRHAVLDCRRGFQRRAAESYLNQL
jgi:hypothetical protein